MTNNREPTATELNGVKQNTIHWPAAAYRVTQVDTDGVVDSGVILRSYAPSEQEITGNTVYDGLVKADGSWLIIKTDNAAGTTRYFAGTASYTTNWTNRASLVYDYFYTIF